MVTGSRVYQLKQLLIGTMAVVNFSVCLVLVLYQLSAAYSDEASSESTDLGSIGKKLEPTTYLN